MFRLSLMAALGIGLSAPRIAWCDPLPPRAPGIDALAVPAGDSALVAARRGPSVSAYREHAPLAWFSLGTLAVGGMFYAIGRDQDRPNVSFTAGSRSGMTAAVSAAGIGALLAAGSYFYCVHRTQARHREETGWQASLDGGRDGNGGLAVSARLTMPLPAWRGLAP